MENTVPLKRISLSNNSDFPSFLDLTSHSTRIISVSRPIMNLWGRNDNNDNTKNLWKDEIK